jgi:hypothetical protein
MFPIGALQPADDITPRRFYFLATLPMNIFINLYRSFANAPRPLPSLGTYFGMIAVLFCLPTLVFAQTASQTAATKTIASNHDDLLPDAPEPQAPSGTATTDSGHPTSTVDKIEAKLGLRRTDPKAIEPFQEPLRLSAGDKIKLSFLQQATPFAFFSMVAAAGWEHLHDGNPKFGTDSAGFGEQLGAAVIRQTSQSVFSDGLAAAAFHQDPRYYRKVQGSFRQRFLYAASRTWRTRTDDGTPTINYSLLTGYAAASALTMTYYPAVSATWPKAASGYGWALLGNMAGNQYHEFWPDIVKHVFHSPDKTPEATSH